MFRWEWLLYVKDLYQVDTITNSDLKMAGILFLWLPMEAVCGNLQKKQVTLFSDNPPTVGWVRQLATCGSLVSAHLIQVLALRLKMNESCPLAPLHIAGKENSMTDVPFCSFGSNKNWN